VYSWVPGETRVDDDAWSNNNDDGVVAATLPFSFTLYGTSYVTMYISTNGNVHFITPNDSYPGEAGFPCLPSAASSVPRPMIAALWDDLVVPEEGQSGGGGVYTDVVGTAPNRTFVIEWRNVYEYFPPNDRGTFEILLDENGEIRFQYQSLSGIEIDGSNAVIGIQNPSGTIGLPYACYLSSVVPERAIRYKVRPSAILLPREAERGGAPGATVVYTETLFNRTGIDNSFTITPSGNVWTTTVEPGNTGLIPNAESVSVTVSVRIPTDALIGDSDAVTVNVSSDLPTPGAYTATAVLTTSVSSFGVEFDPDGQEGSADYGGTVTYTTRIYNRSGQDNNFHLDIDANVWPAAVTPTDTGTLLPDASRLVTVTVQVPAGATLGMRDTLRLNAIGQEPEPGSFFGVTQITTYAGRWNRMNFLPEARSRASAVYFAPTGRVYLIGGEYNNGNTDLPIREYDPAGDTWRLRANLPVGVSNVGAAVIGNAIYVPGGYSGSAGRAQSTLQIFHPLENRTEVAVSDPLPQPRLGAAVAAHGGKLYVMGGSDDTLQPTSTVYEYDPQRPVGSRWAVRAPMPTARIYLGGATVDGLIYAAGGYTISNPDLAVVEAYNPATNSWSTRAPMLSPRGGLALVGVSSGEPGCGGYLYALGGGWNVQTDTVERYDPAANRWESISSLTLARRSMAAAYAGNVYSLVTFGGWRGQYDSTVERVACAGGLQLPTPTPTAPTTPTSTPETGTPTATVCTVQFSDVPQGSTFYPYVRCLACRGIISGYADGTFRPNAEVTRGQLSKIVSNAAGFIEPVTGQTYEDVPPTGEFYLWIQRLTGRGVMSGYPCGGVGEPCVPPGNRPYFRPGANATRGQIAKIVSNAAGLSGTPTQQTYEDVPSGSTFYVWIERLTLRGAMGGYPCGGAGEPCVPPGNRPYFRPNNNATRGQVSKIVANTFYPGCMTP
jgi:N-acetylneuraminic acid mutarotase